jgi:diguanylate cyclase (GGDEF)-like protein
MLDIRTLFVMLILSCLLAGVGVLALSVPAARRSGAVRWGMGNLAVAAGLALVAMRDIIPLWPSVVIGNSLQFSGLVLCWQSLALLAGRRPHGKAALAAVAACALTLHTLLLLHAPLQHRIVLNSAFVSAILFLSAITLGHLKTGIIANARRLMQFFYFLASAVALIRLFHFLFSTAPVSSVFEPDPVQVLNFVVYYLALMGSGVGYLIVQNGLTYNDLALVANTDILTGVRNRRNFMEMAEHDLAVAKRTGRPLVVIMLDMDNFKKINDNFGHATGDEALRKVGEALRGTLRSVDIIGRYGGEEFCVMLADTTTDVARQSAERIRERVEGTVLMAGGVQVPLTLSIGIAEMPAHGDVTLQQLLTGADSALYQAKSAGRNRTCIAGPLPPPGTPASP